MKTASMTAPMNLSRTQERPGLARYLPYAVILALLFALLFAASHSEPGTLPAVNSSLTHLGPH